MIIQDTSFDSGPVLPVQLHCRILVFKTCEQPTGLRWMSKQQVTGCVWASFCVASKNDVWEEFALVWGCLTKCCSDKIICRCTFYGYIKIEWEYCSTLVEVTVERMGNIWLRHMSIKNNEHNVRVHSLTTFSCAQHSQLLSKDCFHSLGLQRTNGCQELQFAAQ